jgi:hypothetical protein
VLKLKEMSEVKYRMKDLIKNERSREKLIKKSATALKLEIIIKNFEHL